VKFLRWCLTLSLLTGTLVLNGPVLSSAETSTPSKGSAAPFQGDDFNDVLEVLNLETLAGSLERSFGDRYGDMWIDRSQSPSVLRINLVGGASGNDLQTISTLTGRNPRVAANSVSFSKGDIDEFHAALDRIMATEPGPWTVGEDPQQNKVIVSAKALRPDTLAAISTSVPPQALGLELSPGFFANLLHGNRITYAGAHEGGLNVWILYPPPWLNVYGECTTGYTIKKDAAFYGLTAGHCAFNSTGTSAYVGGAAPADGSWVGNTSSNTYWCCNPSNSDAMKYSLPIAAARGYVLANDNHHRAVKQQINEAGMPMGYSVCWAGKRTYFETCGNINRRDVSFTDENNRTMFHAFCWNGQGLRGDSGGPVYHVRGDLGADATGIVHGGTNVIINGATVIDVCMSTLQQSIPGVGSTGLYTI